MPEPEKRIEIVNKQHAIEMKLESDRTANVVFFLELLPTPMSISPDAVYFNSEKQLYEIKEDPKYKNAIPKGLIPEQKLNDPKQLSTVLARSLSLWNLTGKVWVFYTKDRGIEDHAQIEAFKQAHTEFILKIISTETYKSFKDKETPAATYVSEENAEWVWQCIQATQIIKPNEPNPWRISLNDPKDAGNINELMKMSGYEPLPLPGVNPATSMTASTSALTNVGIFMPLSANEAANTISLSTETCRPSTHPSK